MTTPSDTAFPRQHLPGLDLLRSLAIVWVMLFHSVFVGGVGPNFDPLARWGWAGVDLFFVLSGFLIGAPWLQRLQQRVTGQGPGPGLAEFYWRRAWRILPAYVVVLVVYQGLPVLREAPGLEPAWKYLSFSFNLLVDYAHNQAFSHAWSLCVEEHFYLIFPLLAWALAGRVRAWQLLALFALPLLGGVALRTAIWLHFDALRPDRPWFIEALYYPTWSRLDGLLAGVGLALLQVHRPQLWAWGQRRARWLLILGMALLGLAAWLFQQRTGLLANTAGWPVLAWAWGLIVWAATSPQTGLGRWRWPGVAWLAALSYSLYLSHKLALHAVETWLLPHLPDQGALQFLAYTLAILATGAALHYAVERPGLRCRDRWSGRAATERPPAALAERAG